MTFDTQDQPVELIPDAINGAEEIGDPLEGLVEKTESDPGAPFRPDVLEQLSLLKQKDPAAFETLRADLKKAGCRVTRLDQAIAAVNGDIASRRPTQADLLLDLAQSADLFHTSDSTGFADLQINGHRETWPIQSKAFRNWLTRLFYEATRSAPNSEALQQALNLLKARAQFDYPERLVHLRVAHFGDRLYLDLCDETWRAVAIDSTGWRVINRPPVRFRRAAGMRPLPVPVAGGSVEELHSFLNVKSDDFVLAVAWSLACLRNQGPCPVLVLSGEQGTAKSTFCRILRDLLDPNTTPLRSLPREDRDLFIAANNAHVLAFDNVSGLPQWLSDTFCRLATGGGFAVRQLYTDQDEVLFDAKRPVLLNGIENVVTRADLADRAIFLTLEPIPEQRRLSEADLWVSFETYRPRILGALLDALVEGLKKLPDIHLPTLPRMADFALWASACETAIWPAGTFINAYDRNRRETVETVIDADPIAAAVRDMMAAQAEWSGTASGLLVSLAKFVGDRVARSKTWPDTPRALSSRLRRSADFLRKSGIEVEFVKQGHNRDRMIQITTRNHSAPENVGRRPSASSAWSGETNGFVRNNVPTAARVADGADAGTAETVRPNPSIFKAGTRADGADGADANYGSQPGQGQIGTETFGRLDAGDLYVH
ncbi:MAG: hypothetical protein HYR63_26065 [Proteobacteria bacterium]|nr:hypothetical protein [Pseudomonadota bacterium]